MSESPSSPANNFRGLAKREIILVTIAAVFFGAIGVVVGSSTGGNGNLNSLSSSKKTKASPSPSPTVATAPSPTPSAVPSVAPSTAGTCLDAGYAEANASQCTIAVPSLAVLKLDMGSLDAQQAALQKQLSTPIVIQGATDPKITVVSCGQPGGYICGDPVQQIGVSALGDESSAASQVTPAPTTDDGRRAAVFLHALTLDSCASSSNSCSSADSQLAAAVRTSVQNLRIAEATNAYSLWEKFLSDPCHFVAPYAPAYEPPDTCYNAVSFGAIFGEKDTTPSEAQFVAWGRQQALASIMTPEASEFADALPASLNLLTPTSGAVAQATGVVDAAGRLAPQFAADASTAAVQAGGLTAVEAVGGAAKVPLFKALFPYALVGSEAGEGASEAAVAAAAQIAARAAAVLVNALSFSVGVVLAAGAILVQRVIDLADAVNPTDVSNDLLAGVVTAKATLPTIASLADDPTHEGPTDMLDVMAAGFAQTAVNSSFTWDGSGRNVLTNADGESDDPAYGLGLRQVDGWDASGTSATLRAYNDPTTDETGDCAYYSAAGAPCADPDNELTTDGSQVGGHNYFWGGADNSFSTLTQTINFGNRTVSKFNVSAECAGAHGSSAAVSLAWQAHGGNDGTPSVLQCPATGIAAVTGVPKVATGSVPAGALSVKVTMQFTRGSGSNASLSSNGNTLQLVNNDAGLDALSLKLS